jgi:indole-3-glycerol phosphate synthase
MGDILDKIIENKRYEVELTKKSTPIADLEKSPLFSRECLSLRASLQSVDFGIIGEIKRKSPSAGEIDNKLTVKDKASAYFEAGIQGISCLTDFNFFGGSIEDLIELRSHSSLPLLRKEFIIDPFQIIEAKASGADAILLISEALTKQEIDSFTNLAHDLGLEVLLELHDEENLSKTFCDADIIGVNNRNLKLQITDIQNSIRLFDRLPKDKLKITESGIKTAEEIAVLYEKGFRGALIGESILKHQNPRNFIKSLMPK